MFEGLNVQIPVRYTGLEITRFFGFGNESVRNDSLLEADYYNINQKYFGAGFNVKIPTEIDLELRIGLNLELSDILKPDDRLITTLNPYGTGSFDFITLSSSIRFDNRDNIEMPSEGNYLCIYGDFYPKSINNNQYFGKVVIDCRTFLSDEFAGIIRRRQSRFIRVVDYTSQPRFTLSSIGKS